MFKVIGFIFILIMQVSCAHDLNIKYVVDGPLQPYVEAFERDYGVKVNYNVKLKEMGPGIFGQCLYNKGVYIDTAFFMGANEYYRDEIVRHELAHCVLDRDHYNEMFNSGPMKGCPVSLMHVHVFASANGCYKNFYDYYINELRVGSTLKLNERI